MGLRMNMRMGGLVKGSKQPALLSSPTARDLKTSWGGNDHVPGMFDLVAPAPFAPSLLMSGLEYLLLVMGTDLVLSRRN